MRKTGGKAEVFFEKSENIFSGIFQAAQAAKRRAWGGNPNKIPIGQNERLAKFGTVVESCSKKVTDSAVLAFPISPGLRGVDSANYAAVFSHTEKPETGKMGVKKQETFFLDFLFRIFANSGGYPVVIPRK